MTTQTIQAKTTDGDTIEIAVPIDSLPTEERAEELRALFAEHVRELDDDWKGRVLARVPATIADDVAEAMDFMGAIVDERKVLPSGRVHLYSNGYRAHGF